MAALIVLTRQRLWEYYQLMTMVVNSKPVCELCRINNVHTTQDQHTIIQGVLKWASSQLSTHRQVTNDKQQQTTNNDKQLTTTNGEERQTTNNIKWQKRWQTTTMTINKNIKRQTTNKDKRRMQMINWRGQSLANDYPKNRPLANGHPEEPFSCKWYSRGASLLHMIIQIDGPLANDHLDVP